MKKLTTLILSMLVAQISYGQIDNTTKNKIKAYYFIAENLYGKGEYSNALDKINEIESLSNGMKMATSQNLKIKTLVKLKEYQKAKRELELLYGLNPSNDIYKEIAEYSSKIDDGVEVEQLALKRKKEQERIANIMQSTGATSNEYKELTKSFESKGITSQFTSEDVLLLRDAKRLARIKEEQKAIDRKKQQRLNYADEFYNDRAVYEERDRYGFIDRTGAIAISLKYEKVKDFSNGLAAVRKNGKWGYVNKNGTLIIPLKFVFAAEFSEGLAAVAKYENQYGNSKCGYINTKGVLIIPYLYSLYWKDLYFKNGFAVVSIPGKGRYKIDKQGKKYKMR